MRATNTGSLKACERCGFVLELETPSLNFLSISCGRYLQLLREGAMADPGGIYITELDKARLESLLAFEAGISNVELEYEIERATVIDPQSVPGDVVTMNSSIVLRLDDERETVALVYPQDADRRSRELSVLSEIGTAVLSYQEGDNFDCVVADRTQRILIEKVIYQPESAGDFHL